MKIAFLDRDGTIVEDYEDEDWINNEKPEFIHKAFDLLRELKAKGFSIIIITNQYLIDEGYITYDFYNNFTNLMLKKLEEESIEILDVFFCPHSRLENCSCAKPNTGMIEKSIKKYPGIDLNKSIIIGDSKCDMDLAIRMNFKGFYINSKEKINNPLIQNTDNVEHLLNEFIKDPFFE